MKSVTTFLVSLTLLANVSLKAAPAEAAIGVLLGPAGAPVILAGGIASATGVAMIGTGLVLGGWDGIGLAYLGIFAFVGGLVVLDEGAGPTLRFSPLGAGEAARVSLSSVELEEFNASIDELNAMAETIHKDLSRLREPTVQDSARLWERYRPYAPSEAAFQAAGKVSAHWMNGVMLKD